MPFWRKDSKGKDAAAGDKSTTNGVDKANLRQKLEKKIYLAQESPEPVYDLSECGMKTVPSGTYSRIKVMLKEGLLLHENELTSLKEGGSMGDMASCLQVLDIHSNLLEKLPDEIGSLKQLRVLHISHNKLKKLPETLGDLKRLQTLDISHNNLKELPESLSKLNRLKTLDISHNSKLKKLPKSLANCRSLSKLVLEAGNQLTYPPEDICKQGTESVMKFLCKECDIDYINPSTYEPPPEENGTNGTKNGFDDDAYERIVRSSLKHIEKQKEDKLKEMQLLEKDRAENEARELTLAASVQDSKKRLLHDLAEADAKREAAVRDMQKLKDKEKADLIGCLNSVEHRTDALINELMAANSGSKKDPQELLREMEAERKEMEERFTIKAGEADKLKEQEVIRAMQLVLAEEIRREEVRKNYEAGKQGVVDHMQNMEQENDKQVEAVLTSKGKHQNDLIIGLLEDEKYQRNAFSALFIKQDSKNKEITLQVEQIQNELAQLSMVEMTKKDLKVEFENDIMKEKRETLTEILLELMNQKQQRQDELTKRLEEMDQYRNEEHDNYWLIQYQKLLDSKPKGLIEAEDNIDPALKDLLAKAGAEDYIPVFATRNLSLKQVSYMKDKELSELGIHNTYLRQKILVCVEEYSAMQERLDAKLSGTKEVDTKPSAPDVENQPSAPPQAAGASALPSAPPIETFKSTECCVCMERKCDIIFLPCGHVCCCWNCESGVSSCPLCRGPIAQRVHLA